VLQIGKDGALDVLGTIVKVDEDGPDHVVEGRLRKLDVAATEEDIDSCSYFYANGVLGVVQTLQQQRIYLLELIISYLLSASL
jgi:hypothetical protein